MSLVQNSRVIKNALPLRIKPDRGNATRVVNPKKKTKQKNYSDAGNL